MKKITAILLALAMIFVFSAPVFAAADSGIKTYGTAEDAPEPCTYGLSNNVYMDYNEDNNGQDFALGAKHYSGNRQFYTTNNTSLIYYFENDDYKGQSTVPSMPDPTDDTVTGGKAL
jgi:hypothetical protein